MFQENIPLSRFSNYKIAGKARYFYEAQTEAGLIKAIKKWDSRGQIFILGGGTNILFDDMGFDGLVLKPNLNYIKKEKPHATTFQHSAECWNVVNVVVGAGTPVSELLEYTITHGLSGLEWAGGLPGTLGGAIRGNAGCFGGEIKDVIKSVSALQFQIPNSKFQNKKLNFKIKNFIAKDCRFNYRHSIFKENPNLIILEVILQLKPGNKKEIAKAIQEKIDYRNGRQPLEYPNIGSIFKNVPLSALANADLTLINAEINKSRRKSAYSLRSSAALPIKRDPFPVVPAAYLLSESGLKGVSFGGAMISLKHPNFIVNAQSATAEDVKKLIALAKEKVFKKFAIKLEEEVIVM